MGRLIVPARQNKPWTEEDDRRLTEMRAVGKSTFNMCAALKRSAAAIKARIAILRARVQARAEASVSITKEASARLQREGPASATPVAHRDNGLHTDR